MAHLVAIFRGKLNRRIARILTKKGPLQTEPSNDARVTRDVYSRAGMALDEARFKLAMSHFASGVTIVTTEHEGVPYGMTVASFASLSLRPPLVLVCIDKSVKSHEAIMASRRFGVSILAEEQAELSNRFASKLEDKFAGVAVRRGALGVPLIEHALCNIECRVTGQLPGGDHTIFVGETVEVHTTERKPLLYYRSGYRRISD
jgi:flavin reductase (DIM6/NTAB) family NADH-FMN oxidoreductase RutF